MMEAGYSLLCTLQREVPSRCKFRNLAIPDDNHSKTGRVGPIMAEMSTGRDYRYTPLTTALLEHSLM